MAGLLRSGRLQAASLRGRTPAVRSVAVAFGAVGWHLASHTKGPLLALQAAFFFCSSRVSGRRKVAGVLGRWVCAAPAAEDRLVLAPPDGELGALWLLARPARPSVQAAISCTLRISNGVMRFR